MQTLVRRRALLAMPAAVLAALSITVSVAGCVAATDVRPPVREHRVASAEGATLHWYEYGRGATTVLLIHGWTCDSTFWDAQVDALGARYRVITLDLAGHGFSGLPDRRWTMAEYADDVVRVADAARAKRIVLVGHSMGGPVAIEAAKRLKGRVIGVIGVDTLRDVASSFAPDELDKRLAPFRADFGAAVAAYVESAFFTAQTDPALRARIVRTMSSARPQAGLPSIRQLNDWDYRAAFAGFDVPLLLLNAASPPTVLGPLTELAPGVRLRTFDGAGHFLMMEQPQSFNVVLLEELARLGQPSAR